MLPYVGSGSTLRGFTSHRFRDQNGLTLQAEWRIMANRFMDTAVFYDAGKVAARRADLDFNGLKSDYGFGVRLSRAVRHATAPRSREESRRPEVRLRDVTRYSEAARHVHFNIGLACASRQPPDSRRSPRSACSPASSRRRVCTSIRTIRSRASRSPRTRRRRSPMTSVSLYEMAYNLFVTAGYKPSGTRAQNINTIDEVPDSSWFTNRIGTTPVTVEELARGANRGAPPDPSRWVLITGKNVRRPSGLHGEGCEGRDLVPRVRSPRLPGRGDRGRGGRDEDLLGVRLQPGGIVPDHVRSEARRNRSPRPRFAARPARGPRSRTTISTRSSNTSRESADGTYRVIAGRLIPGKILGGFLYAGTRPDDPNDLVPHEHRRELRALRVFGAWTNLTDLKAANTLDALVTENGRTVVKHYLQDVGSTFGMCNDLHEWDLSWEHFYQGDTTRKRLFSFGFALSPWQTVDYVEYPSIGKFEGDRFDPRKWRPQTPTTAYWRCATTTRSGPRDGSRHSPTT